MTEKLKNKQVTVANIRFGRPTSPRWDFSVFVSFRYKNEDKSAKDSEIHVEKDITDIYVRHFGKIASERTKEALLKTVPADGFLADWIYPETKTLCFGQGKRKYLVFFDKGTFDPWLEAAANQMPAN